MEVFLAAVERRAFRMAEVATSRNHDAIDIVQDAMLDFTRKYGDNPETEWKALFYRVLQNRIRDWYRRQKVRNAWRVWLRTWRDGDEADGADPVGSLADPRAQDPVDGISNRQTMDALEKALRKLSIRQQQVFLLRAWEGLDVAATAVAMRCSQGSVKTHYSRALATLRDQLEGHWP